MLSAPIPEISARRGRSPGRGSSLHRCVLRRSHDRVSLLPNGKPTVTGRTSVKKTLAAFFHREAMFFFERGFNSETHKIRPGGGG
jgi:hypothetical protein